MKRKTIRVPGKSKYRNVKTTIDGHVFASKREAARYGVLKAAQQAGDISGLELQPRYPLVVCGLKVCVYVADFKYVEDGEVVIEDSKGVRTQAYIIKRKLMKAIHGIDIREV